MCVNKWNIKHCSTCWLAAESLNFPGVNSFSDTTSDCRLYKYLVVTVNSRQVAYISLCVATY